ncbi:MAG: DUF2975 domain-containing protein [Blastomonas sp.]|uniref:DUF2975 domain-containing protein n=1 Tax=Blastomonas sp. TaxID=1909299 RepID=UPI0025864A3E|nr:DUF2975 domain-containing protein [Blastomonas sp.]MCO5792887.1 DUF2975 domain-containing protein [Blastomonas sp.]
MTISDTRTKDPLLAVATVLIWLILGVTAFAGIIVVICIPGVILFGAEFVEAPQLNPLSTETKVLICGLLAGVAALLYLFWRFFRAMQGIVRSVGEGDPFVPVNADRLTQMAWMVLAINIAAIPLAALGLHIARLVGENGGSMQGAFDLGGIILAITLFILARVFRQGAAMRNDLEGTV